MRRFLLIAFATFSLAACAEGQGMNGWGLSHEAGEPVIAPKQADSDFSERLKTITQNLEGSTQPFQSGEGVTTQPEGSSVQKAGLAPVAQKVALIVPLSGPQAGLGQSMLTAAQMALRDLQSQSIQLLPRDSGATPDSAKQATRDALNEGAQLILGPVFADQVKAAASESNGRNIPLIGFTTDGSAANDETFIMGFLPNEQVGRALGFARSRGAAQAVVVAPDTPYGRAVLQTAASMNSIKVVPLAARQGESPDMLAARVRAAAPDPRTAIMIAYDGPNVRRIVSSLAKAGITPQTYTFLGTGLLDDPTLAGAKEVQGIYFASAPMAMRAAFDQRYKGMAGKPPVRLASLAYDATALAAVIAAGGQAGFSAGAIKDRNGFAGVDGIFRFNDNGMVSRGLAILTWEAGALREVAPGPQSF